jgi:hypothetical protein
MRELVVIPATTITGTPGGQVTNPFLSFVSSSPRSAHPFCLLFYLLSSVIRGVSCVESDLNMLIIGTLDVNGQSISSNEKA